VHVGHRRMLDIAEQLLAAPVAWEISIENVDKPPLDYIELAERLERLSGDRAVWLTRAPTFVKKAQLFPGATFVVGLDTLVRIADPRYYGNDADACRAALTAIARRGCRFLVFSRLIGGNLVRLADLELPDVLAAIATEVPAERFREDISSTELRNGSPVAEG
jgi:hypothetical protein